MVALVRGGRGFTQCHGFIKGKGLGTHPSRSTAATRVPVCGGRELGWFAPKGWGGEVYKGREEGLTCAAGGLSTVVPSRECSPNPLLQAARGLPSLWYARVH